MINTCHDMTGLSELSGTLSKTMGKHLVWHEQMLLAGLWVVRLEHKTMEGVKALHLEKASTQMAEMGAEEQEKPGIYLQARAAKGSWDGQF